MSYEGYTQVLCQNGHYLEFDCMEDLDETCWLCQAPWAWWNMVDTTNDCGEPVELEEKTPVVTCKCADCGNLHCKTPPAYHIPKTQGHLGVPPNPHAMYSLSED